MDQKVASASFDADVIVAGAGPAGATAARRLASAGLNTLIVERAAFPRNKPCGGGITTRALTRFPWLETALRGIDVHRISRLHLEGPQGAVMALDGERDCVLMVRRVEFDHALVREAERAGARLETAFEIGQAESGPNGVTVRARDGRRRSAPVVIAADGVHSVLAKRLGVNAQWPRAHVALDMMEETPTEQLRATRPDVLWVAYAHGGLDGYAYVFPKTRHVNAGIGCLLSQFDEAVNARPYELQERFVQSLVGRGVLEGASDRKRFTPFLIPVGGPMKRTWRERVLFAGDAGGFVNPITAEGIYYAMVSGDLAAQAVVDRRGAATGSAGPRYERLWRAELGTELRDATLLQRYLFSNQARVARVVRGAARTPWLTDLILQYTRGELPYREVRQRVLRRFPITMLKIASARFAGRSVRTVRLDDGRRSRTGASS